MRCWHTKLLPCVAVLIVLFLHRTLADHTGSNSDQLPLVKRLGRSLQVQPTENKHGQTLSQKSLSFPANKTKSVSTNTTYWVDEDAPTQHLRNAAEEEAPPSRVEEGVNEQQPKELPIALIIASPVVAVFIIVFVCVAYYCHSAQLDARARELAMRLKADEEMAQVMVQAPRPVIVPHDNTDMEAEHTSLRSVKTQTSSESKRGSVIEDREIIKYSRTRRHSTFII